MSTASTTTEPAFADVYEEHLDGVWRFVRARVPDHHRAQDLTSDVFVRAWRAWDRFDPDRGRVEPWLYTIAHRTVIDWWRRSRPELTPLEEELHMTAIDTPEDHVLQEELLARLGAALSELQPKERDALAMRFAARLKLDDVAAVLGTSTGAAKMTIHRAIDRLREAVELAPAAEPADLEAVIDDVLHRGTAAMPDSALHGLLVHLAVVQDAPVPENLHDDVSTCVDCEAEAPGTGLSLASADLGSPERGYKTMTSFVSVAAFAPVCLACTVGAFRPVVAALGLGIVQDTALIHIVALALTPFVLRSIRKSVRRHGQQRAWTFAKAAGWVLGGHALLHALAWPEVYNQAWFDPAFAVTNRLGTTLLVVAGVVNLLDALRWRRDERRAFAAATATPGT